MRKTGILWVSALLLLVVGVVGALLALAVLSGNSPEDTIPPVISHISIRLSTQNTVEVSWLTDEPATTKVECRARSHARTYVGQDGDPSNLLSTNHNVLITGLDPNTTYTLRLISEDASGNKAVDNGSTFKTAS
jgi:hypothetical protein